MEKIPAKKNQRVIITVLDGFIEEVPKKKRSTESARGSLAQYANPGLWEKKETAWEEEVGEEDVLDLGLETYANNNLDFVDCILYAYKSMIGYKSLADYFSYKSIKIVWMK